MKRKEIKFKFNSVLLIDDSVLDNFINEKMLEATHFSKSIQVCTDGEVALDSIKALINSSEQANNKLPDVIFIDLNMPVMNGFEFIENLKKINNPSLEKCRLVILTSSIHNDDRIKIEKIDKTILFVNKPLTNQLLDNFSVTG